MKTVGNMDFGTKAICDSQVCDFVKPDWPTLIACSAQLWQFVPTVGRRSTRQCRRIMVSFNPVADLAINASPD
jgi:hypothetical protein